MRIKILEYANEKNTNKECVELEENGFVIIDIVYTHHTANHILRMQLLNTKKKKKSKIENVNIKIQLQNMIM